MKRERTRDELPDRDDLDREIRERFASLPRLKPSGRAVGELYARIARLQAEEASRRPAANERFRATKLSRFAASWEFLSRLGLAFRSAASTPARAALLASILTLCIAVPATLFIGAGSRSAARGPDRIYIVRLLYEHARAERVAVIGDFNGWQRGAAEMTRVPGTDLWTIEMPLREGLYRYAFLVDEREWNADPLARVTLKDDFGMDNSLMVLVGEREETPL